MGSRLRLWRFLQGLMGEKFPPFDPHDVDLQN
nr:MAG TPA: hypothetical protein [Caudoviricetes sp.]